MNYYIKIHYRQNYFGGLKVTKLGMASEDGRKLLLEKVTASKMRKEIIKFTNDGTERKFYSYIAGFQYVAFCQLFGGEYHLPENYPAYFRDLRYLEEYIGEKNNFGIQEDSFYPFPEENMNPLQDALWMKKLHEFLTGFEKGRKPLITSDNLVVTTASNEAVFTK